MNGKQICRQKYLTMLGKPMIKIEMDGDLREFTRDTKVRLIEDKFNTNTCPTKNCSFTSTQRWIFRRHVQKCTGETVYTHKQKSYGVPDYADLEQLKSEGFIPQTGIKQQFAVYDIGIVSKQNFRLFLLFFFLFIDVLRFLFYRSNCHSL